MSGVPEAPVVQANQQKPKSHFDLERDASTMLKEAGFDGMTGAKKDKRYRRNKRAERKRTLAHWRANQKQLGKLGPASPVRRIDPAMEFEKT